MTIRERVDACIAAIYNYDYYLHLWEEVRHSKSLDECTTAELLRPFQDFWEILPDTPAIQRVPFYKICDLAEEYMNEHQ